MSPLSSGRCFANAAPQTVTTIVTEQVMVVPERTSPDGSVTSPPVFRTQTRPIVETVGAGARFETLCARELTPERVATLQRALKARLAYAGPITGTYDAATQQAVRRFQRPEGFDSPELARTVAQRLGVIPFAPSAETPVPN